MTEEEHATKQGQAEDKTFAIQSKKSKKAVVRVAEVYSRIKVHCKIFQSSSLMLCNTYLISTLLRLLIISW